MQGRRHSSGSCGRRNLERQLLDKRVRAAEYRLEPGPRSSAPQRTCDLVDHIIVKVEVQRVDGCLELDLESRSRSEEHTSELQSPMHTSYTVYSLEKKRR